MFPLGKLPADVLAALLQRYSVDDPRVLLGPRPGEDAAVIDTGGPQLLVAKTDPITFATDQIGWYAVHVNANDIATIGATPAWFMVTLLLPGKQANQELVDAIFEQLASACDALDITLVGGHTEITHGIDRPIAAGMMLGLVEKDRMVTTGGMQTGDALLVTKGVPIEATAIIAREKAAVLKNQFSTDFVEHCANYLHDPGISVVQDAALAIKAGRIHAMHDPTEGGLATGLWEMADAAAKRLIVDPGPSILPESQKICDAAGLDPIGSIASGALLLAAHPEDVNNIKAALEQEEIAVFHIGRVEEGPADVLTPGGERIARPERDEIARLFE